MTRVMTRTRAMTRDSSPSHRVESESPKFESESESLKFESELLK